MDKVFIDSNIWIYAFISTDDLTKHEICVKLLEVLYQENILKITILLTIIDMLTFMEYVFQQL
jgi:predicted nucleic acid-binding protein